MPSQPSCLHGSHAAYNEDGMAASALLSHDREKHFGRPLTCLQPTYIAWTLSLGSVALPVCVGTRNLPFWQPTHHPVFPGASFSPRKQPAARGRLFGVTLIWLAIGPAQDTGWLPGGRLLTPKLNLPISRLLHLQASGFARLSRLSEFGSPHLCDLDSD